MSEYVPSTRVRGGNFDRHERDWYYPRIMQLIEDGFSDKSIARAVGVSMQTVFRFRKRRGIPNVYGQLKRGINE